MSSPTSSPLRGPNDQPERPNDNTYWVVQGKLIAGEYPADYSGEEATRRKIRKYLGVGVRAFVDLTNLGEREPYEAILMEEASKSGIPKDEIQYRRIPVQDFGIPSTETMKEILNAIDETATSAIGASYVHCRGGIGRTGTTVGCYLVRHGNTGEEALQEVQRLFQFSGRSRESDYSPETRDQMEFVRKWNEADC